MKRLLVISFIFISLWGDAATKPIVPYEKLIMPEWAWTKITSTFTWNQSNTNITVDETTFGPLSAGDSLLVPPRTGGVGYRSISINVCDSGGDAVYIVVYFQPGAFIAESSVNLFADIITGPSRGVKIVGMEKTNHVDQFRLAGGYCSYIWFDSCDFSNSNGIGFVYTNSSLTPFNGSLANSMNGWTISNCKFNSLFRGNDGGVGISIGGNFPLTRYSFWFNLTIYNCQFSWYSSRTTASNFISAFNTYNTSLHDLTMSGLGTPIVANPTGHASMINAYSFHGVIYNIYFGKYNFGNGVRGRFSDIPSMGAQYTGLTRIWNCIMADQRKYPMFEMQAVDTTGFGNNVVRPRSDSTPITWNVSAYNMAQGVGNSDYIAAIWDVYPNNCVASIHNSFIMGLRDASCPSIWFQGILAKSGTGITADTSNNILNCSTVYGFDTLTFVPLVSGGLYNTGTTPPAYITTDIFGNPRPTGTCDIGAVEYYLQPTVTVRKGRIVAN